jgi:hypothetical protein
MDKIRKEDIRIALNIHTFNGGNNYDFNKKMGHKEQLVFWFNVAVKIDAGVLVDVGVTIDVNVTVYVGVQSDVNLAVDVGVTVDFGVQVMLI